MRWRALVFAAAAVLAMAVVASAQSENQTPDSPQGDETAIEPDRPDVTNGTHIVGAGLVQFELGGLFAHAGPRENDFGSPITVRLGVTDWIEARIGNDGIETSTDGVAQHTSIGNTQIGAKLKLWSGSGQDPLLSVLPGINLPTADADNGFGSGDFDYTVALLAGHDVGKRLHVDANYGIGAIGAGGGQPHFVEHLISVSTSISASAALSPYLEGFWLSRQEAGGDAVGGLDGGVMLTIGSREALDGGIEVTHSGGRSELAAFGGFSMVVGHHRARSR